MWNLTLNKMIRSEWKREIFIQIEFILHAETVMDNLPMMRPEF